MSGTLIDLLPELTRRRALVGWMLASFLVTFLATRAITRAIRTGRGPFRNAKFGGVHVHHQVYGIFLLLGAGTAEFTYRPATPWSDGLAILFGMGAALTLDEFALWLHLEDVYWEREGRGSVDAVLVAMIVGVLLLVGVNPFGDDAGGSESVTAVGVVGNLGCGRRVARRRPRRYARTRGSRPDAAVADARVPSSVDTAFNLGMACPLDGARAA